jgi:hypothetical protein
VLRDGAGRLLGADSYRTAGDVLEVGHLGALDGQVPGTGVQLVRELAAVAQKEGKGLALTAPAESESFFASIGFARELDGSLRLSQAGAKALLDAAPNLPGWVQVGWLEGPRLVVVDYDVTAAPVESLLAEIGEWTSSAEGYREDAKVQAMSAVKRALVNRDKTHPEDYGLVVFRDASGKLQGVTAYARRPDRDAVYAEYLGVNPNAPVGTGRQMIRGMAGLASERGQGLEVMATQRSASFYQRIGMTAQTQSYFGFTAEEAAAFASGLTGPTSFGGQLTWELAVAGASDWLREVKIPKVVDELTETTHQALVDALAFGLDHGESTQQLANRIRHLDRVFGRVRAERIARTEVITANRHGGYQIGLEAGCTEHEWRARVESPRTRDWHRMAHKQRVPYGEPYTVLNRLGEPEKLLYPGDRSLGAGPDNTIQCRCSERRIKPGVTDDKTLGIREHGLAGSPKAPTAVVAGKEEKP